MMSEGIPLDNNIIVMRTSGQVHSKKKGTWRTVLCQTIRKQWLQAKKEAFKAYLADRETWLDQLFSLLLLEGQMANRS